MNVLLVEPVELSHFMKSEWGYILLGLVMVRPIFHEKWDEKVPRQIIYTFYTVNSKRRKVK